MSHFRRRIHVSLLLLLADVAAIHDGAGHASRPEASSDELMRRDGPRASRRQEPSSATYAEEPFDSSDPSDPSDPLGAAPDPEALVEEDQPWSSPSFGFGSGPASYSYSPGISSGSPYLSSFSNVLGPKSAPPPGMPMVSATASKDSKDKKDIDFTNIDYIGCIIPQWTDGDWLCAEAADVPDTQIYDDAQHRTRKKLREGDACTVQCPDPRYWQSPQPSALVCRSGRWRDQVSRVNVKKIECETAARWFFFFGFLSFGIPLCCCCAGAGVALKMRKKKKDAAPTEPAGKEGPLADAAAPDAAEAEATEPPPAAAAAAS